MPLTKGNFKNFPNIGPVHAGVMVGALASVSVEIRGLRATVGGWLVRESASSLRVQ